MLVVCFTGQYVKTGQYVVPVTKNFLEIHLFWAGKGTCCIPSKGYYGPAVSALSATPSTHLNLNFLFYIAVILLPIMISWSIDQCILV